MDPIDAPTGLCACGCQQTTAIAPRNIYYDGVLVTRKGEHMQYVTHHNWRKDGPEYEIRDCGFTTPCWVWRRSINGWGYGQTTIHENGTQRTLHAHLAYYERAKGSVPPGMQVDHLCKNRPCVNPDHLEAVPPHENVWRSRLAKLTKEQVLFIAADTTHSNVELSDMFGVTPTAISCIKRGKAWEKLTGITYVPDAPIGWARDYDCCCFCGTNEKPYGAWGLCKPCALLYHRGRLELVDPENNVFQLKTPSRKGRWAVHHDVCIICGKKGKRLAAFGLCSTCYHREHAISPDRPRQIEEEYLASRAVLDMCKD